MRDELIRQQLSEQLAVDRSHRVVAMARATADSAEALA